MSGISVPSIRGVPGPTADRGEPVARGSLSSNPNSKSAFRNGKRRRWMGLGDMKHRNSHLLVGYWSRLRKGRAVPDQTDIDPRSIKRMLSHVFILEASNAA